jgi:hypothetical protein
MSAVAGRRGFGLALLLCGLLLLPAARAAAVPPPEQEPFYRYEGSTPLAEIVPGTVLKTRTLPYHVVGLPLPVKAVQLLYRSTGETGEATVNGPRCCCRRCGWGPRTWSPTSPSTTR